MFNILLALGIFFGIFLLLLCSVLAGRRFALWQKNHDALHKLQVVNVAEGAVFALLGLLIAFTFSGAYERFENRKIKIIDEVNAIDTTYSRLDLLAPKYQVPLKQELLDYVADRIAIYRNFPHFTAAQAQLQKSEINRAKLWQDLIVACTETNNSATTMLIIPAFNNLFEIAYTRLAIREIHPPFAIFLLLIGLAALSSFLAGYSTVGKNAYNFTYIVTYVAITALTIYIIIDLEMPRLGIIRVDSFDHVLTEEYDYLNNMLIKK